MAEIQIVQPNLQPLSKEQMEGLAQWARHDVPLQDNSADALWGAGHVAKGAAGLGLPAAEKLVELLKLNQRFGVLQ